MQRYLQSEEHLQPLRDTPESVASILYAESDNVEVHEDGGEREHGHWEVKSLYEWYLWVDYVDWFRGSFCF